MAFIFCASGGSNTSPYETWAKAATSLQTAITQASTGDTVILQYNAVPTGDAEVAVDTVYTFDSHGVTLISGSNDGGSAWTPTAMGTTYWVGNSTTNCNINLAGAFRFQINGVTFRVSGSTVDSIQVGTGDGAQAELENCYLWLANTATTSRITLGNSSNNYIVLKNCTLRFSSTSQAMTIAGQCEILGGSVSSAGSAPTTLLAWSSGTIVSAEGFDISHLGSGTLVGNNSTAPAEVRLTRCNIGSGMVPLATQTAATKGSAKVWLFDCANGDTHGLFGYYDALGSIVSDTGIYFTSGGAAQSWKIVSTSLASAAVPFVTPWIQVYNSTLSAITPYFEILRDGSTTAYTDGEVWGEFTAKNTTTVVTASLSSDRRVLDEVAAVAQANGAGLGSWTGEAGTAWSGMVDSGSSITPAEIGHLRGRVCVGVASTTVYLDPQIRT